jgi:hypothetical protein
VAKKASEVGEGSLAYSRILGPEEVTGELRQCIEINRVTPDPTDKGRLAAVLERKTARAPYIAARSV